MKNILKLSCFVRNDINRIRRSDMKERIEIYSIYMLDTEEGNRLLNKNFHVKPQICICDDFTLYLCPDGNVEFIAGNIKPDLNDWKKIIKLCAGKKHIAALTCDGRVFAAGDNTYGQCEVNKWQGITDIETGDYCTIGTAFSEKIPFDRKRIAVTGSFSVNDRSDKKTPQENTKNTGYRMPGETIEKYGGMVDFTNRILGGS